MKELPEESTMHEIISLSNNSEEVAKETFIVSLWLISADMHRVLKKRKCQNCVLNQLKLRSYWTWKIDVALEQEVPSTQVSVLATIQLV